MAEITKRIVLFLISLVLIILYLVSATTSYANSPESFSLLSPKQMIKQEISNVPENNIIFNEAQEYPLRSFTFDPIIYFNDNDQVWICGVELAALDYTGTKVIISLYSAIFEDEKDISHMIMLKENMLHLMDLIQPMRISRKSDYMCKVLRSLKKMIF